MKLLDTNICIAFLNGADEAVSVRLKAEPPEAFRLCSVVKAELFYGARKSGRVEPNLRRLESFFSLYDSLPFDDEAARWYGTVRAQLAREGRPIGGNDLQIASIALSADCLLVTRNQDEFARVAGLRVEVW